MNCGCACDCDMPDVTPVPPGWKLIGETENGLTFYNWITHELSYLAIDRTDTPRDGTFTPVFIKPRVPDGGRLPKVSEEVIQ